MPLVGELSRLSAFAAILDDEAAFRAWHDRPLPRVYRYLYNRCGRIDHIAEELTQQTFVEAIRSRARQIGGRRFLVRPSSLTTW